MPELPTDLEALRDLVWNPEPDPEGGFTIDLGADEYVRALYEEPTEGDELI